MIMFTGLITHKGKIKSITKARSGAQIVILTPSGFLDDVLVGDSISVSGLCLTVTSKGEEYFTADISGESLGRTTVLKWQTGREVNLEKSMKMSDKFGGHFVMGHIDGTGIVRRIESLGESRIYQFETTREIMKMIAVKGSVSIDGVSLTPSVKAKTSFGVAVIPHTLRHTTLMELSSGDEVNIEVDIIARYIYEFSGNNQEGKIESGIDDLRLMGY